MGLKLDPCQDHFTPWLIAKKGHMGMKMMTGKKQKKGTEVDAKYDAGLGVYAVCQFLKDEIITVYLGVQPQEGYTDESYRLEVANGKCIDVLADK